MARISSDALRVRGSKTSRVSFRFHLAAEPRLSVPLAPSGLSSSFGVSAQSAWVNCPGEMKRVGTRIRLERKKQGLTLERLARRVGINPITLHRIETGKSSPSVALLSEIAQALNHPIVSLVQEIDKPLIHIKRKDQQTMSVAALKVKVVGPRKMIRDNIVVTYGELKKGKRIDAHSNSGIEWAYIIEGKCEHKQDDQSFILETGDSISFDARVEHSVLALEKLKFIAICVKEQDL